jgi:ubiquinone biosynthesis protein
MISIRKLDALGRTPRYVNRYQEILNVLIKYGFDDLVDALKVKQYIEVAWHKISGRRPAQIKALTRPERVRMALEELGPTFVKLGQLLSTRPDLIPLKYAEELSKLQDKVPPFPYEDVPAMVKSETGRSIEEIFESFDKTPIAAASLGQVHKATLKGTKQEVAIKVQRPGIQKTVEIDLEMMLHLASVMERNLEEAGVLHPTRIVEEFSRTIEEETDYTIEASHIEHFARQFADDQTIHVPKVFRELTTKRILTMEYINGIKASAFDQLKKQGYDFKKIANRGATLLMQQIFVHGFYHADPHPGNIMILPGETICFLDFGLMGRISEQEREDFTDLVGAIVKKDEKKSVDALLKLSSFTSDPDKGALERDMAGFFDQFLYLPLKELEVGKMLKSVLEILTGHGMSLKPDLFLMVKALSIVEGLGRSLDPDFQIVEHAEPFVRDIQASRYNLERVATGLLDSGKDLFHLLKEIPGELGEVLKNAKEGKLGIQVEYRSLDRTIFSLGQISDRIVSAIVTASLIVGSSIVTLSNIPPKWRDIPIIGVIGFIVAGVMGFRLFVSTLRKRRGRNNDWGHDRTVRQG